MAPWVKTLAAQPGDLGSILRAIWWKERLTPVSGRYVSTLI